MTVPDAAEIVPEARPPGLRWLGVALTFGRSDNGHVWPASLGEAIARALEGVPMSWYEPTPGQRMHVPSSRHMFAVHEEYQVALIEKAWVEPHGVYVVAHFWLPLSPRADQARRELLDAEARGALLGVGQLSVMAHPESRVAGGRKIITGIKEIYALDFVTRAAAEGCLIRSLAFDEIVGPPEAPAPADLETLAFHVPSPGGSPA
jgi:hypothetical protein